MRPEVNNLESSVVVQELEFAYSVYGLVVQLIFHFILHGLVVHLKYELVVCEPIWTGSPADIPLHSAWTSGHLMYRLVVCEPVWTTSS